MISLELTEKQADLMMNLFVQLCQERDADAVNEDFDCACVRFTESDFDELMRIDFEPLMEMTNN